MKTRVAFATDSRLKQRSMKMTKDVVIAQPIEAVWEVLGNQFGQIDKWASLISRSTVSGEGKLMGLDYSIRNTITPQGETKQELTSFDPKHPSLSYRAVEGNPFFIRSVKATWSLRGNGPDSTELFLDFEYQTKGLLGLLLIPIVHAKFNKVGDELLDDLKYYLENGKAHPRKVAAMS